ncbi:MAG: 5-formyltetrahydrofolate cyclo-ligase [Elusimicrobia bacterium RIFOXYA2_FULL_50_26]|nr:MAG: 5-formyltetrahydrofolate cyclo-ligase [Elusimicrobia bacterium RIFOXYA2_FULL_50_26]OGS25023.1 MAG: 5-formyltetrahydrofolate cyclo-ligase [Elusimicrobia bacterium RIFOXYB2_FULL_50_12]
MRRLRNNVEPRMRRMKSLRIARLVQGLPVYLNAKTVMFYVTHDAEVETGQLMKHAMLDGKNVALPVTDKDSCSLSAARIRSLTGSLAKGAYGILEPRKECSIPVRASEIDLVIVPGIAFDGRGVRLGFGKGYYDRWLSRIPLRKRVALAYSFQVVPRLPKSAHDVPVGTIVTESEIIRATPIRKEQ